MNKSQSTVFKKLKAEVQKIKQLKIRICKILQGYYTALTAAALKQNGIGKKSGISAGV